jgi:catechol 2,3-dioxygenase
MTTPQPNLSRTSSLAPAAGPSAAIDPGTRVGALALSVANLDRSLAYYTGAIGLELVRREGGDAILAAGGTPLLLLREQPSALPWMTDAMTGLYHFAILVPRRVDLGRWLRHYLTLPFPPPGQGDHVVSEALYLRDPDGHGIEIYADRPREGWRWTDGRVQMGGGPVDIRGLLAEAERAGEPWTGMPRGTRLGHMHLQVGNIPQAESFYHGLLGFDVTAAMSSALFLSAGGYHHHIGMNTWHSEGAPPAPNDTARLRFFTVDLPSEDARRAVVARLEAAGHDLRRSPEADVVAVQDPWHNTIVLQVGTAADAQAARALIAAGDA